LFTLVDAIELEATSAERGVLDALEFIRAVQHRRGEWIEETCVVDRGNEQVRVSIDINAFASEMWKRTLRDKRRPGMLARRHLEVCVFSHLAAELRSGDLAVAGSDSYANLHAQMMTWEDCEAEVADFCEQAGIPADAKTLVAFYKEKLTETAAAVDAGYPANADLRLEGGKPVLARRKGADRRPSAIILESAILERLPDRSLLDVLARSAHLTGWHRHFGPASGSDPKIRDTLGRYVVTAFAYGGLDVAAREPIMPAAGKVGAPLAHSSRHRAGGRSCTVLALPLDFETNRCSLCAAAAPWATSLEMVYEMATSRPVSI
jgi:hypothetical protein